MPSGHARKFWREPRTRYLMFKLRQNFHLSSTSHWVTFEWLLDYLHQGHLTGESMSLTWNLWIYIMNARHKRQNTLVSLLPVGLTTSHLSQWQYSCVIWLGLDKSFKEMSFLGRGEVLTVLWLGAFAQMLVFIWVL